MKKIYLCVLLGFLSFFFLWDSALSTPVKFQSGVLQVPSFDIPVTYNKHVRKWIHYFQTKGYKWFKSRLERSHRYLPSFTDLLRAKGLPEDLGYLVLIESGFSARAISRAQAVGYWQFIKPTANQYGLKTNWWLDERRDYKKSTLAAAEYLSRLHQMFGSWYLAIAAYNMGESRLQKLISRHKSKNFWVLSRKRDFPRETKEYVPKMLAALLIAKAPKVYGFKDIKPSHPYQYDYLHAPGGTDLHILAQKLNLKKEYLRTLNPELVHALVPRSVSTHRIRIPKGHLAKAFRVVNRTY